MVDREDIILERVVVGNERVIRGRGKELNMISGDTRLPRAFGGFSEIFSAFTETSLWI